MLDLKSNSTDSSINHTMPRKRARSHSIEVTSLPILQHIEPITSGYCMAAPFSEDPVPCRIRAECDYSIKIDVETAKRGAAPRTVRVYADGAFDLFHQGHARLLQQAKSLFPRVYLIVGVSSDENIHSYKANMVLNEAERYDAVRHCRYVDEVLRNAPSVYTDEFLEKNKIDFVARDDIPHDFEDVEGTYAELKRRGMLVATEKTNMVSTSNIVARIVKNYDIYVRRNLARGYSAKELNVSFLKEKKLKFQNKMDELKDKGKELIDTLGERTDDMISKWEDVSREVVENFLLYFFRKPLKILHNSKKKILRAITPPESTDEENCDIYLTKRRKML
ncbi:choline-phosphate cytidylyltransferase B-like isoform X2 [Cylas formicarius]|uniref:choline-phosphate cytidylyltransferase B-like isoform X2 n=1 Tax=Cylas formicarius TaxID=197179 RepID=UPI0029585D4A|nr:choline-phosphate cytidylyltransferase B-like isoform X2 [Cylas formicarius]